MENMRTLLRSTLSRSLATMPPHDRLAAAWPVVCGPAMARRGKVAGFEDGMLQIEVLDPAWLEQMRSMQAILSVEVGRVAGVQLGGIHFYRKTSARRVSGDRKHE